MKRNLILIFKGFIIGIGKIIPGVSGAIIAILLKVYEPALNAISNLKNNLYENAKYLATLGIGIVLAIILGSNIILYFLKYFYLQTIFLFLGMMISGIMPILKEIKNTTWYDKMISFLIIIIFIFISNSPSSTVLTSISTPFLSFLLYFISGILDAICSIVPGISGTAVLMMIGTYNVILKSMGSIFQLSVFWNNLCFLLPFFIGILFGGYFISKIISYTFKNYRQKTYCFIFCFSLASMWSILKTVFYNRYSCSQILVAGICFFLGYLFTKKMNI